MLAGLPIESNPNMYVPPAGPADPAGYATVNILPSLSYRA